MKVSLITKSDGEMTIISSVYTDALDEKTVLLDRYPANTCEVRILEVKNACKIAGVSLRQFLKTALKTAQTEYNFAKDLYSAQPDMFLKEKNKVEEIKSELEKLA